MCKLSLFFAICIIFLLTSGLSQMAWAWPTEFLRAEGGDISPKECEEVWGLNPEHAKSRYSNNGLIQAYLIKSSAPANILWPDEKLDLVFQFANLTDRPIAAKGVVRIIKYQVYTLPGGDVFKIGIKKIAEMGAEPIAIDLAPQAWQDVAISPAIPAEFGGYALIIEFPGQDRLWGAAVIRTFKPEVKPGRFYKLTMDLSEVEVLTRLGCTVNRIGVPYAMPTSEPEFEKFYQGIAAKFEELKAAGLPATVEFGGGRFHGPEQPLGRPRPWLDETSVMLNTKFDLAWLPAYDQDFRLFVKRLLVDYGWPKGPINAIKLWNEPWNGISISGWGADDERYREITRAMLQGLEDAKREAGVQVWHGGADSSSNTFDKYFGDGSQDFLPYLDFMSIHYQGTSPMTTMKMFLARRDANGKPAPVEVWDTESWVANSDERVAGVLASMYSFGLRRVVGIQSDNVVTAVQWREVKLPGDGSEKRKILQTWSVGAAVGAFQHFVGERNFCRLLWPNGLPYLMLFAPEPDATGKIDSEDSTIVVLGDMGPLYGFESVAWRTCRSLREVEKKERLRQRWRELAPDSPERSQIEKELKTFAPIEGATLVLRAQGETFGAYDLYGNPLPVVDGRITISLDAQGVYLRGNGKPGSFQALLDALATARVEGYEPLATKAYDMTAPIGKGAAVRLELTNILNRPIKGTLTVTLGDLQLDFPPAMAFAPHETQTVEVKIVAGQPRPDNLYPLRMVFDAGDDGKAVHEEVMRVNWITRRKIAIDGKLDDWKGCLPQIIQAEGGDEATLMEKAWLPFLPFDTTAKKGFAVGYLAYDDEYFYFAAKVQDDTRHPGTLRFAQRDDDQFFYPAVCFSPLTAKIGEDFSVRWTGYLLPPAEGKYSIYTISDDGVRLWIDGALLIDNWTMHAPTEDKCEIACEAGKPLAIKLEYMQGKGGACLQLLWQPPQAGKAVVPTTALRVTPDSGEGLKGEYFAGISFDTRLGERIDKVISCTPWTEEMLKDFYREGGQQLQKHVWPEGVRRYSYRKNPILPAGNAPNFDNIQIAFNVLPLAEKPMLPFPPGTRQDYVAYLTTDYEYALNTVAEAYGGGFEIWRLRYPGMPEKHFYPRQPSSPFDGPAQGSKMITHHEGNTRITECALPWSEIPHVKKMLDEGKPIKFGFRVNDEAGVGCLELAAGRSVSRLGHGFKVDWVKHWQVETEFGWEK